MMALSFILLPLLLLSLLSAHCTLAQPPSSLYFVSSSRGSDGNDGRSPDKPWASLTAVSAHSAQLQPGDVVYLCNSDRFFNQSLSLPGASSAPTSGPVAPLAAPLAAVTISGQWDCTQKGVVLSNASYPLISPAEVFWSTGGQWMEVTPGACSSTAAGASSSPAMPCLVRLKSNPFTSPPSAVWVNGNRSVQARSPNLVDLAHRQGVNRSQRRHAALHRILALTSALLRR